MSRPRVEITDEQAAIIARHMMVIDAQYPIDHRDHRPFVRAFLRAVFDATGKIYSPAITRKLMGAFAPGRGPATATLDSEKKALESVLEKEAVANRLLQQLPDQEQAVHVLRRLVDDEASYRTPAGAVEANKLAYAQRDFLQGKLSETEVQLADMRAQAARLAAEADAARAERDRLLEQLEKTTATTGRQEELIAKLTESIEGMRRFALSAVDQVRGETRAWQDRCTFLESQLKELKQTTEYFRQIAYARGAAVPDSLRKENKN